MKLGAGSATHPYLSSVRLAGAAFLAFGLSAACRSAEDDLGDDPTDRPTSDKPQATCPGSGMTVCDLKLESSPEHPRAGDPVVLSNLVVTTPTMTVSKSMDIVTLAGFFVQDRETSDTLRGQYSGVLVTYRVADLGASAPKAGDVVHVTGVFDTFGRDGFEPQKQIQASLIERTGQKGAIEPVMIERAELVGTGGEKAPAYEGVLIRLNELTVTSLDVMVNGSDVFGAFEVNRSLIVSSALYRYSRPVLNEQFASIAGVLRLGTSPFESGAYFLTPRGKDDVVPKNAAQVVTTIRDIQDPSAPGRPLEMCQNLTGSETIGKCATAKLTGVVVTAVDAYVSSRLRALWVQDDSTGGEFSGIKVVYNPDSVGFVPERGQRIDVEGEVIEYRRGLQIQYPTLVRNGTDTITIEPTLVTPEEIARSSTPETNPFEGVLVRIENARVTTPCLEDSRGRDHGNWIVEGSVYIGSAFEYGYNGDLRPAGVSCLTPEGEPTGLCGCDAHSRPNDMRTAGDAFRSITGIMDFTFDEFQLQPREASDLVR